MIDDIENAAPHPALALHLALARIGMWAQAAGATVDDVQEVIDILATEYTYLAIDSIDEINLVPPPGIVDPVAEAQKLADPERRCKEASAKTFGRAHND